MRICIILLLCCLLFYSRAKAQLKEPFKPIHGGSYTGMAIKASPDPLIRYQWQDPKAADSLQLYFLQPKTISTTPLRSFKQDKNIITVVGKGELLFDFGTESAGWIEFESNDLQDSIEVSISEYNEPAILNAGAQNPIKTKRPQKHGNSWRLELNDNLYEGVRFAWIHVNNFSKPWHIENIRLVSQVKPVNYKGSFFTNDTMLNRIWYTGAYTVKLNMLQDYFGAILMERSDRHSWTGDAYPAQAAALAAFGNYDAVKKNIEFTSGQDNGIAAYSIYWVLSLVDYYNYTGDASFLRSYVANADRRLQKAFNEYDNLPQLGFMGWDERLGAGFENTQIEEAKNTYKMLCINGWKQFSRAMLSINENALSEKYAQFAEAKTKQVKAGKGPVDQYGIHAVSEAINAGLLDDANIRRQSQKLFADRLNRLSYSPFNQYFIIQAMALAKQHEAALTTIKDNWGGQIDYGGTTFFEVYRPSWNTILKRNDAPANNQCGYTSLAHPWGAGVTKWLSENILGIKPANAGFKTFTIIPFLNNKLSQVEGDMPTPFGTVSAAFDIVSGKCAIKIPDGTMAEKIGLPKSGKQISRVTINSKLYWNKAAHQSNETSAVEEDGDYVYLKNIKSGSYKIDITYSGPDRRPKLPAEQFKYLIKSFKQDSTTSGNWKNKYGKNGYMFFGRSNNKDSQKLPVYIDSIRLQKNSTITWDSLSKDNRAVNIPVSDARFAAAIITRDPIACLQTMTIDVFIKGNQPCNLSMYFLDWDKKDRRSALEIFDLETLNIIAPVQLVDHYEKGKYVSFGVNKSIRIRVNQVRGQNAAVSALFID